MRQSWETMTFISVGHISLNQIKNIAFKSGMQCSLSSSFRSRQNDYDCIDGKSMCANRPCIGCSAAKKAMNVTKRATSDCSYNYTFRPIQLRSSDFVTSHIVLYYYYVLAIKISVCNDSNKTLIIHVLPVHHIGTL